MLNSLKKIIKNNKFMLSYIYNLCPSHIFITLFVSVMGSFSSVLNLFITRFIINAIQTVIGQKNGFTIWRREEYMHLKKWLRW